MAHLEAWLYSSGDASLMDATATLQLTDSGGSETFTLSSPMALQVALAWWQTQANASGTLNGTYTFAYDPDSEQITVSCDETFSLVFSGNLHAALGFSAATGHTGATSYASDTQPLAAFGDVQMACGLLEEGADVETMEFRHSRTEVLAWGNHDTWRIECTVRSALLEQLLGSYCAAGRLRVYQTADTTAWSPTNPDGYLDGYVVGITGLTTWEGMEMYGDFTLVLAVPWQ